MRAIASVDLNYRGWGSDAGLQVAAWNVDKVDGRTVFLMDRFDRAGDTRVPFLSALSMLEAAD
jgi:serine/threonine-protein kinase HipA